ncbi:THO complex subunit 6 homolog [Lingula anatina]|uniref:THO complex subunit 6 homolog n=1 Tax=Lingula anatina TaxID=7574 RepID=A0A1S3H5I8_LINAN|nr:THO complex subunit 6 homolog [Lingula anatina]|eukprot:XP_013380726.1 THO complex subunit 6 homolog [Lingula anatina]
MAGTLQFRDHDGAQEAIRKQLHTTIFSQAFSPGGKYLAVGTSFGEIAVFNISASLSRNSNEEDMKPTFLFKATDGPIYCLTTTDKFLISAGTGDVIAWNWVDVLRKTPKVAWSLPIPTNRYGLSNPEVNSLAIESKDGGKRLFAGCGDNNTYIWDLESGSLVQTLAGHTDYVHSVALKSLSDQCVTGSEDGTVRLWDLRTPQEPVAVIEPYSEVTCARSEYGRWIGCVAVDPTDDWLVCGGGPKLSLWHLRTFAVTTVFDTPGACQQYTSFFEDTIISAGSEPYVNHWYINGDRRSRVPCTPTSVCNVTINSEAENNKVLSVVGSSAKVDLCTNFGYKALSLTVC